MEKTEKIILTTSVQAAGALIKKRFVNFAGTQAVAADPVMGVANANYDAGEQAGVDSHGEILVEAGAAIAQSVQVQSDANGRAITLASGVAFGRAMDAATAAGELIRVQR